MHAKPTVSLSIRLSPEVREAVLQSAKANNQTLTDFVEKVLAEATSPVRRSAD